MSKYADKKFWTDTADRAVATVAQAAVAAIGTGATGLIGLDFVTVGSIAGLAGLISVLTSIAFRGGGNDEPPTGITNFTTIIQDPRHAAE